MLRISDALGKIVSSNKFLQTGFTHRLFNLSQLARFLKPLLEAQLKKDIQESAVLMALSRLQAAWDKQLPEQKTRFPLSKITLQPNLFTVTYPRSVMTKLQRYERLVSIKKGYINVSEGTHQITVLVEQAFLEDLSRYVESKPTFIKTKITGIGVQFDPKHAEEAGFLVQILQYIAFQGINVVEIFSTYSEFSIFVAQEDARLALDTLLAYFEVEN